MSLRQQGIITAMKTIMDEMMRRRGVIVLLNAKRYRRLANTERKTCNMCGTFVRFVFTPIILPIKAIPKMRRVFSIRGR